MSVSHNINTDNHFPQSRIPQPAVDDIKTWRCKIMNNGEQGNSAVVSPQQKHGEGTLSPLSGTEETTSKTSSAKLITPTHPRIHKTYFVRLAEESPKKNCDEYSDSSTYDSLNLRETDTCRDSSDTDSNKSYSSDGLETTIKVVEYEVASTSNSEDLFTNESSSGSDEIFLAFASAICETSKYSSGFADPEEDSSDSHTTYDSELSSADYWVCVKCKNKQNNPMFRLCEKCYQIRKTHFPPRPRLRKSRSTKQNRSALDFSSVRRSATTSAIDKTLNIHVKEEALKDNSPNHSVKPTSSNSQQNGLASGRLMDDISRNPLKRAAESSSGDDVNSASPFYKVSKHDHNENNFKETVHSKHLRKSPKRKLHRAQSKAKATAKRKCYELDGMPSSDTENETGFALSQSICGSTQGTQKDSGFSSAPSSQERKSSSEQQNDEDCETSDTVCDELNESDVAEITAEKNCIPSTIDSRVSDILLQSSVESQAISPLVQSVSECSDAFPYIQAFSSNPELLQYSDKKTEITTFHPMVRESTKNNGDFPNYGSCMTCLTEPKNGVFVHSRFLHLCCCYKCAMKIWNKNKKCPICNCAVKNVMKLFVY